MFMCKRVLWNVIVVVLSSLVATRLWATTFVIPEDTIFIAKAHAIVIGTVEGSYADADAEADAPLETIFEIRLERVLKGPFRADDLLRIASPGGERGRYGVYVAGAASFRQGQRVLLFLTHHKNHWEPTDMMLGEFSFMTAPRGERVLVRGHDSVDDRETRGIRAVDKIRSEDAFIDFIEHALEGRPVAPDYVLENDSLVPASAKSNPFLRPISLTMYAANSYTQVGGGPGGVRWPTATIAAALNFARHTGCTGCDPASADTFITSGMTAWNSPCATAVNLQLTGTTATAALATTPACNNACDFNNVIEFGDPNDHIAGSWAGSGTVARTTIIFDMNADTAGTGFRQIVDADVIFQDGYVPGNEASAPQATTHELGHAIGWRHSNADPSTPNAGCGAACGGTENCNVMTAECAGGGFGGSAIMFWLVNSLGYTLQTWDLNAIRAVYPGAACASFNPPTSVVATATSGSNVHLTWAAPGGTAPGKYNIYRTTNVATTAYALRASVSFPATSFDDSASVDTSYMYKIRSADSGGLNESVDSNLDLATTVVFTNLPATANVTTIQIADINQLRSAIDKVRALGNTGPGSYSADPGVIGAGVTVKAAHVNDMRTFLNVGRTNAGVATVPFTNPLTVGVTVIKALDFNELYNGVQ